jgi:cytochrome c553
VPRVRRPASESHQGRCYAADGDVPSAHGLDGLSKVPDAPNIAGQTESYLNTQLQAFKSGARKNDAMSLVAPSLSDKDVEDLAAYFSAIEVKIVKIPGD